MLPLHQIDLPELASEEARVHPRQPRRPVEIRVRADDLREAGQQRSGCDHGLPTTKSGLHEAEATIEDLDVHGVHHARREQCPGLTDRLSGVPHSPPVEDELLNSLGSKVHGDRLSVPGAQCVRAGSLVCRRTGREQKDRGVNEDGAAH